MGTPYTPPVQAPGRPSRITIPALAAMARDGTRIAMLTAYDASLAAVCDRAGVDVLLVGDSLGMVIQGRDSTLSVSLDDVLYHTRCVAAGAARALVIADLPFGSFQASPEAAFIASVAAMQAGAQMVKLEGGAWLAPTVAFLTTRWFAPWYPLAAIAVGCLLSERAGYRALALILTGYSLLHYSGI